MNSFDSRSTFRLGERSFTIYNPLRIEGAEKLPYSLKILLENLLRHEDNDTVKPEHIEALMQRNKPGQTAQEISYQPTRVLMQDFTGVPAIVDLAAMRHAMHQRGKDPSKINPLKPTELVVDHSVQVDVAGREDALDINRRIEFSRNKERYQFLKWGQKAFSNLKIVPPNSGIVHQVNIEYLARVVFCDKKENNTWLAYPDTLVGTDSHTTMVNGIGVLGWGVGGIEAEASMLGQAIPMLIPSVVGFELNGRLPEGSTATDLVLTVVNMLRSHGVVGKFVEFYGTGLKHLPLADRCTIANMAPEYGATCGIFPIDQQTLNYLHLTGRKQDHIDLIEGYAKETGLWHDDQMPLQFDEHLSLDLSTIVPSIAGPKRPQDTIKLSNAKKQFHIDLPSIKKSDEGTVDLKLNGDTHALKDGTIVIAAITSCTNTSNPSVMIAAGLLAKKAFEKGLRAKP
ncbi:MAG: aconitate hydratase, partial [Candidatus Oxydemutatoraceae bacterium WSBS_2016_MAG_OTU14]